MKKTTILDFLPNSEIFSNNKINLNKENMIKHKNRKNFQSQGNLLNRSLVQMSLSQIVQEQENFNKIPELLGFSWKADENGFGYTDNDNIMVFSTILNFRNEFFNVYKINDFKKIETISISMKEPPKKKTSYITIQDIDYDEYYLLLALKTLGEQCKVFQHSKMKLLYLKNENFAALICPKF